MPPNGTKSRAGKQPPTQQSQDLPDEPGNYHQLIVPMPAVDAIGTPVPRAKHTPPRDDRMTTTRASSVFTSSHALLVGMVGLMTNTRGIGCWASNKYLGRRIGKSESAVEKMLRDCVTLGFVTRLGDFDVMVGQKTITRRVLETPWCRAGVRPDTPHPGVVGTPQLTADKKKQQSKEKESECGTSLRDGSVFAFSDPDTPPHTHQPATAAGNAAARPGPGRTAGKTSKHPPGRQSARSREAVNKEHPTSGRRPGAVHNLNSHTPPQKETGPAAVQNLNNSGYAADIRLNINQSNDTAALADSSVEPLGGDAVDELVKPIATKYDKAVDPRDAALAARIAAFARKNGWRQFGKKKRDFAEALGVHRRRHKLTHDDLEARWAWYESARGTPDEFRLALKTPREFVDQWGRLEAWFLHKAAAPTIEITPAAEAVVDTLLNVPWPDGCADALPAAVQSTMGNVTSFFDAVMAAMKTMDVEIDRRQMVTYVTGPDRALWQFADAVTDALARPADFAERWWKVHKSRYDAVPGCKPNLAKAVWHPAHPDYRKTVPTADLWLLDELVSRTAGKEASRGA